MSRHLVFLLMLALAAGCGGKNSLTAEEVTAAAFDDLRSEVIAVVESDERRETTVALVDKLERDYRALHDSVLERRTRIRALNADYDTPRADFIALTDELEASVRDARRATALAQRAFMASTTPEEWAAISKTNTKTMQAAIAALQAI